MHYVDTESRSRRRFLRKKRTEWRAVADGAVFLAGPWHPTKAEADSDAEILAEPSQPVLEKQQRRTTEVCQAAFKSGADETTAILDVKHERAVSEAVHAVRYDYLNQMDEMRRDFAHHQARQQSLAELSAKRATRQAQMAMDLYDAFEATSAARDSKLGVDRAWVLSDGYQGFAVAGTNSRVTLGGNVYYTLTHGDGTEQKFNGNGALTELRQAILAAVNPPL